MEDFKVGELVKYLGCSQDQINWGDNDDPNSTLIVGDKYYVEKVEVHSWHTKLHIRGIAGRFNSVCFEQV